ncbi:MAG TPA: helix-turn-helix transcriptional regulator [Polyangiaceae bacterium]
MESAYDLGAPDNATWLARVTEATRAELGFEDGVVAYTYEVAENGWITPHDVVLAGAAPEVAADLLNPGAFPPEDAAAIIKTHTTSGVGLATRISAQAKTEVGRAYFHRVLSARGFVDAITLNATDPTRHGVLFFAPMRHAPKIVPSLTRRYAMLGAHLAAGLRLRRAASALRDEAVLDTNGKVAHATGSATAVSARESLRTAVRAVDRARGKMRKRDPVGALEIWRGLVAGRWSLVDRFESDGRHFLVAHPNPPDARDPRALTARERQVAGFVALGQSNKMIAYELGISASTVGVLAARAAKKLGLRSRAAFAAAFMPRG